MKNQLLFASLALALTLFACKKADVASEAKSIYRIHKPEKTCGAVVQSPTGTVYLRNFERDLNTDLDMPNSKDESSQLLTNNVGKSVCITSSAGGLNLILIDENAKVEIQSGAQESKCGSLAAAVLKVEVEYQVVSEDPAVSNAIQDFEGKKVCIMGVFEASNVVHVGSFNHIWENNYRR